MAKTVQKHLCTSKYNWTLLDALVAHAFLSQAFPISCIHAIHCDQVKRSHTSSTSSHNEPSLQWSSDDLWSSWSPQAWCPGVNCSDAIPRKPKELHLQNSHCSASPDQFALAPAPNADMKSCKLRSCATRYHRTIAFVQAIYRSYSQVLNSRITMLPDIVDEGWAKLQRSFQVHDLTITWSAGPRNQKLSSRLGQTANWRLIQRCWSDTCAR